MQVYLVLIALQYIIEGEHVVSSLSSTSVPSWALSKLYHAFYSVLFNVAFFGNRVWGPLNWYAITSNLIPIYTQLRAALNRCHQISGYKANQTFDSIPACRVAISVKLL